MRNKHSESRHSLNRDGSRDGGREGLSEETNSSLGFTALGEELGLGTFLVLRDEESGRSESTFAGLIRLDLMVKKSLDVLDRQKVFSVHGNNYGVPNLRDQDLYIDQLMTHQQTQITDLRFVLDFHIIRSKDFGIDPLGQPGEDILPRGPDTHTDGKASGDREDSVPNDIPQEGIQEEQSQVHDKHDSESKGRLIHTQTTAKVLVATVLNFHTVHDLHRVTERQSQEEVRFGEFAAENEEPKEERCDTRVEAKRGIRRSESLVRKVLSALASHSVTKHSARRQGGEGDGSDDGTEKLDNTENQRNTTCLVKERNID